METVPFICVAAVDKFNGIGKNNSIPWPRITEDLKYFRQLTCSTVDPHKVNAVIMGRKTFQSMGSKPLPNRHNIVISKTLSPTNVSGVKIVPGFEQALESVKSEQNIESVFVIGGGEIYKIALAHPNCLGIRLTIVVFDAETNCECDVFFPCVDPLTFKILTPVDTSITCKEHPNISLVFCEYQRTINSSNKPHFEIPYTNLVTRIIENGQFSPNRTGVATKSVFHDSMSFDLRNNSFPLLTCRKIFWRGIVEELLWFISGKTDSRILSNKGIKIWDGNTSRQALDNVKLSHLKEGDAGANYSFQWRHFGAKYIDMNTDYSGQGVDQLLNLIQQIKSSPNSRRHVLSAWNPQDLNNTALPPCHMICVFTVRGDELSCSMFQRSCDVALGLPFNIASYALLTYMIAHICNLKPGDLHVTAADCHLYVPHIDPMQELLKRIPISTTPKLSIARKVESIDEFKFEDFILENYHPHPTIEMKMVV